MKKITLGLVLLLVMCCFTACGKNNASNDIIEEIQQTLNPNDEQVQIAFGNDHYAKKTLLLSSRLHSEGLIALCTNPEPLSLDNGVIQDWFKEAFERTELTSEQQVQIAKMGNVIYTKSLLQSTQLTGEGLIAICENPGNLPLDFVQNLFNEAMERTELTPEQEVKIAKLGKRTYNTALLWRTNLSADGLAAICENPEILPLQNPTFKKMFNEVVERIELNAEKEVKITESLN